MQNERTITPDKTRENEIVVWQVEHKLELEDRGTQLRHQHDMIQAQQKLMFDIISVIRSAGGSGRECPDITYLYCTVSRI